MEHELLKSLAAKDCKAEEMLQGTFMGNEAFYVRMLGKLPSNTCLVRMRSALEAGDAAALFDVAHELKGVYAALGLTPLWQQCSEIVEIARAGSLDGVPDRMVSLEQGHYEYVNIIEKGKT